MYFLTVSEKRSALIMKHFEGKQIPLLSFWSSDFKEETKEHFGTITGTSEKMVEITNSQGDTRWVEWWYLDQIRLGKSTHVHFQY